MLSFLLVIVLSLLYYIYVQVSAGPVLSAPTWRVFTNVPACFKWNVLKFQGPLEVEHVTRIAIFVALFHLFVSWKKSVVQRTSNIKKNSVSNDFLVSDCSTSCMSNLLVFLVCRCFWTFAKVTKLGNCSAMTNSADADFRFVAQALSDAYL